MRLSVLSFILLIGFAGRAGAQIDPSSALLLKNGPRSQARDSGVDSGRYTVKPKTPHRPQEAADQWATPVAPADQPLSPDWELVTPEAEFQPVDAQSTTAAPAASASAPNVAQNASSTPTPSPTIIPMPTAETPIVPLVPLVPLVQVAPKPKVTSYDTRDDRRWTLLQFSLAPGYLYNNSDSNYTFRRYSTNSPTAAVDARVWLKPTFAIDTTYLTTMSGSISDSSNGARNVTASQDWFTLGLRGRKFFGTSRLAPTLIYGADYSEYQMHVPSDAMTRESLSTSGLKLSLETEIPENFNRAWVIGVSFAPKQKHTEGVTDAAFSSGSNVESNVVGLSIGEKFSYDHASSIFWKLSHTVEKDLFSGDATKADSVVGVKPSSVGVTNSFTVFSLGFTWGS